MKKSDILFLAVVFFLALFLRFYRLADFVAYHQDQVRDLLFIKEHFDKGQFILLGPKASVGDFYLPPFWYYLMSISYFFSKSPLAPAYLVALFGSVTAPLIYLFCRKLFDQQTAFFASLLYAVSPLSIEYSRFAWNPNPIPLFTILTLYFLYEYLNKNKPIYFYLSVLFANFGFQLHYQGVILFVFCFVVLFFRPLSRIKDYFISFLVLLLPLAPFIYFEFTNGFRNSTQIVSFFKNTFTGSKFGGLNNSFRLFVFDYPRFVGRTIAFSNIFFGYLLFLFSHLFLLYGLYGVFRKKNKKKSSTDVFFVLFFSSLFVLFIYRQWIIDYYLEVLIVPLIIFFTFSMMQMLSKYKSVAYSFLAALVGANLLFSPTFSQPRPTLAFFENINTALQEENESASCIKYKIKTSDLQFAKKGAEYIDSLSGKSLVGRCQKHFVLCEKPLCDTIGGKTLFLNEALTLQFMQIK